MPLEQAFLAESPDASEEAQVRTTGRNRLVFFWSHKWLLSLGRPYAVMHVYALIGSFWQIMVNLCKHDNMYFLSNFMIYQHVVNFMHHNLSLRWRGAAGTTPVIDGIYIYIILEY